MTDITIPTSFPSQADPAAVVTGPNVRFTVLTSRCATYWSVDDL